MYHTIVASRVRNSFRRLSSGDIEQVINQFAPHFQYTFFGHHALSGTRHSREAMRAWFERIFRIFPGTTFDPQTIIVKGWPWDTTIIVRMKVSTTLKTGKPYENVAYQTFRLRWGRILSIETLEDTQHLVETLKELADAGVTEVMATPILDSNAP
jgi:ketosteroid isomerase-like protein